MARPSRALILAALLGASGCGPAKATTTEFSAPLLLTEMLEASGVHDVSEECVFQILDRERQVVPHALLRMDWPDLGRLAFQTDGEGSISIRFPKDTDIEGVVVRVERKPGGQDLTALPYEECTEPIHEGAILLTVR